MSVTAHRRWTQSNIDDLRARLAAGDAAAATAQALDRSQGEIERMTQRLGLGRSAMLGRSIA
ncbi:hypothetical protein [Sphingomonas corticis]|jgi:hypothetical protein|uniref:Uncharacterized protein n=1 Tax=Sphingomonas corticis TaxID=2722791 RepID=A0ABX1CHW8_9SPHN|nr:hypothetical protein [Sphingomonas corticis]NJR77578.1 hypothetical protein [Sphingomonas corticis]